MCTLIQSFDISITCLWAMGLFQALSLTKRLWINYKWERLAEKLPPCSQDHWWFRGFSGKFHIPLHSMCGHLQCAERCVQWFFSGRTAAQRRGLRNLSLCRSNAFYSRTVSLSLPSPLSPLPASPPPSSVALTLFEIQDFTGTRCINGVDCGSVKWLPLVSLLTRSFKFPSRIASAHSYQLGTMFS